MGLLAGAFQFEFKRTWTSLKAWCSLEAWTSLRCWRRRKGVLGVLGILEGILGILEGILGILEGILGILEGILLYQLVFYNTVDAVVLVGRRIIRQEKGKNR